MQVTRWADWKPEMLPLHFTGSAVAVPAKYCFACPGQACVNPATLHPQVNGEDLTDVFAEFQGVGSAATVGINSEIAGPGLSKSRPSRPNILPEHLLCDDRRQGQGNDRAASYQLRVQSIRALEGPDSVRCSQP